MEGKLADAAYQAWHKGILKMRSCCRNGVTVSSADRQVKQNDKIFSVIAMLIPDEPAVSNVNDNYQFILTFFSFRITGTYSLCGCCHSIIRMREIPAFIRSLKTRQIDLYKRIAFKLYA